MGRNAEYVETVKKEWKIIKIIVIIINKKFQAVS